MGKNTLQLRISGLCQIKKKSTSATIKPPCKQLASQNKLTSMVDFSWFVCYCLGCSKLSQYSFLHGDYLNYEFVQKQEQL